jgi:hypothetical protein
VGFRLPTDSLTDCGRYGLVGIGHARPFLVVTAPANEGKELAPRTLNAILKKAGLK